MARLDVLPVFKSGCGRAPAGLALLCADTKCGVLSLMLLKILRILVWCLTSMSINVCIRIGQERDITIPTTVLIYRRSQPIRAQQVFVISPTDDR